MDSDKLMKLLLDSLVEQAMLPRVDQYNNQVDSIFDRTIRKWIKDNESVIYDRVIQLLSVDKLASKVADSVMENISKFGGTYNSYSREKYIEDLNKVITQKLGERIASTIDIDKKS